MYIVQFIISPPPCLRPYTVNYGRIPIYAPFLLRLCDILEIQKKFSFSQMSKKGVRKGDLRFQAYFVANIEVHIARCAHVVIT